MNTAEQQIIDGVAANGWFVVTYVPGPDDPEEWYGYTVGLTKTAGWPEIICFGLDADRVHAMLRDAIAECWERGIRPEDGIELSKVLQGRAARLKSAELPASYFAMADWYAAHSGTAALAERLQLIWPDRDGRFPDHPDCDAGVREKQTPKVAQ